MNLRKTVAFWERVLASITYAEANEHETALQILADREMFGSRGENNALEDVPKTSLPQK